MLELTTGFADDATTVALPKLRPRIQLLAPTRTTWVSFVVNVTMALTGELAAVTQYQPCWGLKAGVDESSRRTDPVSLMLSPTLIR